MLQLFHRPVGLVRTSFAEGGPWEQRRTECGRQEMIAAAHTLPILSSPTVDHGWRVAFLSGERFWYQSLFCFVSLQMQVPARITPVIFDDGTLTDETRRYIRRVVSWVTFQSFEAIEDRIERLLPSASFPFLRARRSGFPLLRKLTDIHLGAPDWTLFMDSDMLFFRRPDALIEWFSHPRPIFMQDIGTWYGYSAELMKELARVPVPEGVNSGLYALYGPSIDWEQVEYWCRSQLERQGPHYFQEQALTALILGRSNATPLAKADYIVMPNLEEGYAPSAVLHHYVAASKRSYFQHGWRRIAAAITLKASGEGVSRPDFPRRSQC
jgi:hypothetical protein